MESIESYDIIAHAKQGAEIGDCLRECIEVAAKECRNVLLTHSGKKYKIDFKDLIASVREI